MPSCFEQGHPQADLLFPDPMPVAIDYYRRTGIFPIMHIVGVSRELADRPSACGPTDAGR